METAKTMTSLKVIKTLACALTLAVFVSSRSDNICKSETITHNKDKSSHQVLTKTQNIKSKRKKHPNYNVMRGQSLFLANGCLDCHRVHETGSSEGVVLDGIARRRTKKFIRAHLKDPEEHVAHAAKEFGSDPNLMPPPNLNPAEIDDLVAYLMSLPDAKPKVKKQTNHP